MKPKAKMIFACLLTVGMLAGVFIAGSLLIGPRLTFAAFSAGVAVTGLCFFVARRIAS